MRLLLLLFFTLKQYLVNEAYNKKSGKLVDDERDGVPHTAEMLGFEKKKKGRVKLEDLTRYTMVKRIW